MNSHHKRVNRRRSLAFAESTSNRVGFYLAKQKKHLFAIAVLMVTACGMAFGDQASDERELTQLLKDLNAAIVKPDIAFLEQVLDPDYTHYRPHGNVENRAQYLENRKTGHVDFDSLIADDIKVRVYGDTALVTYRSTAKGKDQDGAIDEQRRWTRVFVRHDGHWKLVHSQGTTIQKP
jgi:ketosteroid isomerase-like protein